MISEVPRVWLDISCVTSGCVRNWVTEDSLKKSQHPSGENSKSKVSIFI